MRDLSTATVWLVSLVLAGVGAMLAAQFVFMAFSLDPAATIADGGEAWWDAGIAVLAFLAFALVCALGLLLWHSARLRPVSLVVLAAEAVAIGWACLHVYREYF